MSDVSLKAAIRLVKQGVLLEDIANRYTELEEAGVYLKGKCPITKHEGKEFVVTPEKQVFYCFHCHEGGDSLALICRLRNCSLLEAVDYIKQEFLDKGKS